MNERLRQTLLGLIWPGPIAGPLPINLFRILAPILVFYLNPFIAIFIMGSASALFSVAYFRLLRLEAGGRLADALLRRLPTKFYQHIETKGSFVLFASSAIFGVFTYAVFLKVLKYQKANSESLLIISSFTNSIIWTGFFWGGIVAGLRYLSDFAFK